MKYSLVIFTLTVFSVCLICGGCQSDNAAGKDTAALQPSEKDVVKDAEPVQAKVDPVAEKKVEIAAEPAVKEPEVPARTRQTRRRGLYGDWDVKMSFNEREWKSILSFSRDQDGATTGQWISFWGVSELTDITFENDTLSFVHTFQGRDGQTISSTFSGTMTDDKLAGVMTSDMGENPLQGQRSKRMPRAVGNWDMKMKMGDREFTSMLVVTADENGELEARWESERGEHEITDVQYERRKLTFKRKTKMGDRQWESTFEGTIQGDTLSGIITSDRGEITAEGKLVGASLIGNWNLEIASDRGNLKQRLKVNPDLSGMYGSTPVETINLKEDLVSFKIVQTFGERTFETSFEGKLAEAALAGELITSRGNMNVTGTKVVRRTRQRSRQ